MKNPYAVLQQKERDLARVRQEIRSLLIAIPLLEDSSVSWDEIQMELSSSYPEIENSVPEGVAAPELYYPFVRTLRNPGK